ncbi:hypothetical protein AJ79_05614 [Helicocarpus griseus UAMH5409]|uniref:Nephrocystin 3-like N-terminal domain-containing protein n=1 Tax=Helicocarpus griseus UAMH5409 TaxID=1447875 RepID=A0A2B7XL28_9EURO|nr:hypothetical protein AJ79_05614 [Helicocarpus griseus UAMH5409]
MVVGRHWPDTIEAGNTMITAIVVDDLQKRFEGDKTTCLAYLYLGSLVQQELITDGLLRNILKQVSNGKKRFLKDVRRLHERFRGFCGMPCRGEIRHVLHTVSALYLKVFIILNAIDKCLIEGGCGLEVLSEVFEPQKMGANVLCTSRFVPGIVELFKDCATLEIPTLEEDLQLYETSGHSLLDNDRIQEKNEETGDTIEGFEDGWQTTPLLRIVQEVCHRAGLYRLSYKNREQSRSLLKASMTGYRQIIKLLVEKGANLEARDTEGKTPLMIAVESGEETTVELLLKHGVDLEAKDAIGNTPLLKAMNQSDSYVKNLLLGKGAQLNAENDNGDIPLSLVGKSGKENIVDLPVSTGADSDIHMQP